MQAIDLKKKVFVALLSIFAFILSYIFLLASAVGLTILCGYLGIIVVAAKPGIFTLLIGVGLIGLGVLVLFFLLKFLFKTNKVDRSGMIEIQEVDEPKLFALIRTLSSDVGTTFPKKIYLTPEVNAAVFYDSNFWSMFFPVRKNLQIGLGLVNSVTASEFKAILAHEFGHFSQRSMKVGSYVYNVNQVIHNMLFDNESYDSMISKWSNISGYFAFFAAIAVNIVKGIQWLLVNLYKMVNLSYMGLSREMEFHADEIAASIAGSQPLISSLVRLELADSSYNSVVDFYNSQIAENNTTHNIYPQHSIAMKLLADKFKIAYSNGLPDVLPETSKRFNKSLLVIKNQWASHPTTEDRVERLKKLNYISEVQIESAWIYFSDQSKAQQLVTGKMFEAVTYNGTPALLNEVAFNNKYNAHLKKYEFDERYLGYYDTKEIEPFDLDTPLNVAETETMNSFFNDATLDLLQTKNAREEELQILEQIESKTIDISTFDYNGIKYRSKDAGQLIPQIKNEKEVLEEKLAMIDKQVFSFFMRLGKNSGKDAVLQKMYQEYFDSKEESSNELKFYNEMLAITQFIHIVTPFDQIRENMTTVKEKEKILKQKLNKLKDDTELSGLLSKEGLEQLNRYLSDDWTYFHGEQYLNDNLQMLFGAMQAFYIMMSERIFRIKKQLLDFQISLLATHG